MMVSRSSQYRLRKNSLTCRIIGASFVVLYIAILPTSTSEIHIHWNVCPRGLGDVSGDYSASPASSTMTHLLFNASFPCRARIRAWTYYRARDRPPVFAAVWRKEPSADDYFRLVGMNVLPAGRVGWHHIVIVRPSDRISVDPGDFIGFHHSGADVYRFTQSGAIATEIRSPAVAVEPRSAWSPPEQGQDTRPFYVSLLAGYFNENFHVDMPQTFHTTDRRLMLSRPALHAELDYCNSDDGMSSGAQCSELPVTIQCSGGTRNAVVRVREAVYRAGCSRSSAGGQQGAAVVNRTTGVAGGDCYETDISRHVQRLCPRESPRCRFDVAGQQGAESGRRAAAPARQAHVDISFTCQPSSSSSSSSSAAVAAVAVPPGGNRAFTAKQSNDVRSLQQRRKTVDVFNTTWKRTIPSQRLETISTETTTTTRLDDVTSDTITSSATTKTPTTNRRTEPVTSTLPTVLRMSVTSRHLRHVLARPGKRFTGYDVTSGVANRSKSRSRKPLQTPTVDRSTASMALFSLQSATGGIVTTPSAVTSAVTSETSRRQQPVDDVIQKTTPTTSASYSMRLSIVDLIGVAVGVLVLITCLTGAITACILRMRRFDVINVSL